MNNKNEEKRDFLRYDFGTDGSMKTYKVNDGIKSLTFATNDEDEGLWVNGKQVRGTGTFTMPPTKSAKYWQLKKLFNEYSEFI